MEGDTSSVEMPRRNLGRTRALQALMLGVIVLLLVVSVFYYSAAEEMRDERNRTESALVLQLGPSIELAGGVAGAFDEELTMFMRFSLGQATETHLMEVRLQSLVISTMYPSSSVEAETFLLLEQASLAMWFQFYDELDLMWSNITAGTAYEKNATLENKLIAADALLQDIVPLIGESIDPSRDWAASPYSMVSRMDLQAIAGLCNQIIDVMGS